MLAAPEWLPDPTGRHVGRYWDGTRWTESVDDGTGVVAVDLLAQQPSPPSAVAGWYPDPTRRQQMRYWDGTAWTTSVASGGNPFQDTAGPVPDGTPGPMATIAAWYPDPSGRYPMRWWETTGWSAAVSPGGKKIETSDPDPAWPPPIGPRLAPPSPVGLRSARKAGWHLGTSVTLKAQGRAKCPQCGGHLKVVEVARPGHTIEYTLDTTAASYPPCAKCGFVPPWASDAGLYPDPYQRHQFRYWDGQAWTERVTDGGVAATDPQMAAAS